MKTPGFGRFKELQSWLSINVLNSLSFRNFLAPSRGRGRRHEWSRGRRPRPDLRRRSTSRRGAHIYRFHNAFLRPATVVRGACKVLADGVGGGPVTDGRRNYLGSAEAGDAPLLRAGRSDGSLFEAARGGALDRACRGLPGRGEPRGARDRTDHARERAGLSQACSKGVHPERAGTEEEFLNLEDQIEDTPSSPVSALLCLFSVNLSVPISGTFVSDLTSGNSQTPRERRDPQTRDPGVTLSDPGSSTPFPSPDKSGEAGFGRRPNRLVTRAKCRTRRSTVDAHICCQEV